MRLWAQVLQEYMQLLLRARCSCPVNFDAFSHALDLQAGSDQCACFALHADIPHQKIIFGVGSVALVNSGQTWHLNS